MELRFIELNEDKTPKTNYSVTYPSMENLENAGLMLNDSVVLVDFDGDNGDKESLIIDYLETHYPTLKVISDKGVHLYYSKPQDIIIKSKSDVINVGGFQCDYKTGNQYAIVKRYDKERERNQELTLTGLPDLPHILYPLSIKTNLSNMADGDGRNNGINSHLFCVKQTYATLDIEEIGEFINDNVFAEPLNYNELHNTINSVLASNPLNNMDKYTGNKKDMISLAKWLVPKLKIKLYNGKLYFRYNDKFISDEYLLLREIAKHIELTRQKDGELNHQLPKYAELIDSNEYNFKIQIRNGLISNGKIEANSGEFTPFYLDVTYDSEAYDKNVDDFLNFVSNNKEDVRTILEEILGHILLVNKFPHKIFFLTGNGANGKSTFVEMVSKWAGKLTSFVDIANFDDGTCLASLIGKIVNISDDVDSVYLEKSKNLKTMSSGNIIGVRAIYSQPITIKNTATLIFTANEPPTFKDKSYGILRRLMIIPFDNTVVTIIPNIIELLSTDNAKSYLLNLALKGIERINNNGMELTTSETISKATKQYHLENDSVQSFVYEHPDNVLGKTPEQAYNYYIGYTNHVKLTPVSRNKFSRRLTTLGYTTKVTKFNGVTSRKITKSEENYE